MPAEFPTINYQYWSKQNGWNQRNTIQGMITLLKNRFPWYNPRYNDVESVIKEIGVFVRAYFRHDYDNQSLKEAFIAIQVWGGMSARNHTVNILENWEENEPIYKFAVDEMIDEDGYYSSAFRRLKSIRGLGTSFITKHIAFWTGKGKKEKGLPILDDVIAKILYDRKAERVNYYDYRQEVYDFADANNIKSNKVESAIFSFAQYYWETAKTGTNKLRNKIRPQDAIAIEQILNRQLENNAPNPVRNQRNRQRIPVIDRRKNFTPNSLFKNQVFRLINEGKSQGEAMKLAADELSVILAPSYYKYPGSHVHRWKKQGYPSQTII